MKSFQCFFVKRLYLPQQNDNSCFQICTSEVRQCDRSWIYDSYTTVSKRDNLHLGSFRGILKVNFLKLVHASLSPWLVQNNWIVAQIWGNSKWNGIKIAEKVILKYSKKKKPVFSLLLYCGTIQVKKLLWQRSRVANWNSS